MTVRHPFFIYRKIISLILSPLFFSLFRISKPKLFCVTYECWTQVLADILDASDIKIGILVAIKYYLDNISLLSFSPSCS